MKNHRSLLFAVFILLLTFYLDILDLPAYPTGTSYDESVNTVDAGHVLEARQVDMLFYTDGRVEMLYRLFLALFGGTAGQSIFVFRLTTVFLGALSVAAAGAAGRAMFLRFPGAAGHLAMMAAMTGLAVNQGFMTLSRSLYRGVPATLFSLMFLTLLWRGLHLVLARDENPFSRRALLIFVGAGLSIGLTMHTYTSALAAAGLVGIVIAHLVIFHFKRWRRWLPGIIIVAVLLGIFLSPVIYLNATNQDRVFGRADIVRSEENSAALERLLRLQDTEYLETLRETIRVRYLRRGDVNPQYDTARAPFMPRGSNPLFYAAIALGVLFFWRYESTQVLGFLLLSMVPVTLSIEIFHGLRGILGYSVVPLLIALAVGYLAVLAGRWPPLMRYGSGLLLAGLLIYAPLETSRIAGSYRDFFDTRNPVGETREDGEMSIGEWYFRPQHRESADYILNLGGPVYMSAHDLNNPMMRSQLQQRYPHTRTWIDLPQPLDLPAGDIYAVVDLDGNMVEDFHVMVYLPPGDGALYILPPLTDSSAQAIRDALHNGESIVAENLSLAEVGRVTSTNGFTFAPIQPAGGVIFGGRAQVTGITAPEAIIPGEAGTYCLLWERTDDIARNKEAVVQLWSHDSTGLDGVDSRLLRWLYPTSLWRAGEQIPTCHALTLPADSEPGLYWLATGVFEPNFPFWEARDVAGNLIGSGSTRVGHIKLPRPDDLDIPEPDHTLDVELTAPGDVTISLLGYEITPGETLDLTLYWSASGAAPESYTIFVHVEDSDAQIVAQQDSQPEGGRYPTLIWGADEIVVTQHQLAIPADAEGAFTVYSGMYSPTTQDRLPVVQNGQMDENGRVLIPLVAEDWKIR